MLICLERVTSEASKCPYTLLLFSLLYSAICHSKEIRFVCILLSLHQVLFSNHHSIKYVLLCSNIFLLRRLFWTFSWEKSVTKNTLIIAEFLCWTSQFSSLWCKSFPFEINCELFSDRITLFRFKLVRNARELSSFYVTERIKFQTFHWTTLQRFSKGYLDRSPWFKYNIER